MLFAFQVGQHSTMPVMLAPSVCTAAATDVEQETVNVARLESAAQGFVNVMVGV